MDNFDPVRPGPLPGVPCRNCGAAELRIELRPELIAKPLGSHSLSGNQLKVSAIQVEWPWMVCGACRSECKGKRDAQ